MSEKREEKALAFWTKNGPFVRITSKESIADGAHGWLWRALISALQLLQRCKHNIYIQRMSNIREEAAIACCNQNRPHRNRIGRWRRAAYGTCERADRWGAKGWTAAVVGPLLQGRCLIKGRKRRNSNRSYHLPPEEREEAETKVRAQEARRRHEWRFLGLRNERCEALAGEVTKAAPVRRESRRFALAPSREMNAHYHIMRSELWKVNGWRLAWIKQDREHASLPFHHLTTALWRGNRRSLFQLTQESKLESLWKTNRVSYSVQNA